MNGSAGGYPPRRGLRDWAVDICLFLLAVAYGVAWSLESLADPAQPPAPAWSQVLTAGACTALWLRRRWPVGLAVALVPVSTFADLAAGAQLVALFTVAIHRPVRYAAGICAAIIVFRAGFLALFVMFRRPPPDVPLTWVFAFTAITSLAVVGWGLFVRHRRQLALSQRERAARAETEARLRAEQAQHHAREEIAREMHDVLGHRLSLLSVHAGALEYRPDAPPEEIARAAAVIRESAHQALQDLREVIGVLRAPVGELPQPTLADLAELVAESRAGGMRVGLREHLPGPVPGGTGRTAYRIVQEGLTNARKHAPGTAVEVDVAGAPGDGLTVEVRNAAPADPPRPPPGTGPPPLPGQGLIGLAERVSLAEGRLEHGHTAAGGYRLRAWLPWPP
ncbi:sensor histidine kinase [Nocardiopsis sediminis]|uniref:histidine kinase n=1 Tax=Nocardiopsis sediminis TaxID=1778267 RepID=A0ABV8FLT0_9ACTN